MRKFTNRKSLFFIICLFVLSTLANATDYYVSPSGNDANSGTFVLPKKTIQAAINAAGPTDVVKVLPGSYSESAPGSTIVTLAGSQGPYQFGLFFDVSKSGLIIMGVDAFGVQITSAGAVVADVTLNPTNNFGYSGVFVNADNITMTGLNLHAATGFEGKTVEVIGDNFTFKNCRITDGYSLYLNDWSFDVGLDQSHLKSYWIEGNNFENGTSIDIASGAGYSGPVSGRKIINNDFNGDFFTYTSDWPLISFNGSGTGIPWFVHSVGGAIITGNTFVNSEQYIRHRGIVDNSQFNWSQYWNNNAFDKSVITLSNEGTFLPRSYSYPWVSPGVGAGSGTFNNVIRIGSIIKADNDIVAQNGDVVKVGEGFYDENVIINKNLTIKGANAGSCGNASRVAESIIDGNNGTHPGFVITANDVTIDGFKVQNCGSGLYESGIYTNASNSQIINNILFNNEKGVYASNTGASTVQCNLFDANNRPGPAGQVAIYSFTSNALSVMNNEFKGQTDNSVAIFDGSYVGTPPNHLNLIFNNNYLHDNDPGSSAIYAAWITGGEFAGNVITNGKRGIKVAGGNNTINIHNNSMSGTVEADVMVNTDFGANTGVQIHSNSLTSCTSRLCSS